MNGIRKNFGRFEFGLWRSPRTALALVALGAASTACDSGDSSEDAPKGAAGSPAGGSGVGGSGVGGSGVGGSGVGGSGVGGSGVGGSGVGGSGVGGGGAGTGGTGGAVPVNGAACPDVTNPLFCENFEGYAEGPAAAANGWTPTASSGTLAIDAVHARGTKALHVHTDGNGRAYIQVSPFVPPNNSFFGRMHIWVTAFPTAPNYAHFTLVEAAGTGAGLIRPIGGQYIEGKGDLWGTGSDGGPTGDWTNWRETTPAEAGKWVCLEWELAAANNAINIWIDGVAKPELSATTTMHGGTAVDFVFPTFNKVWFGWWLYQGSPTPPAYDLWIDDIALASQRAGCGPQP